MVDHEQGKAVEAGQGDVHAPRLYRKVAAQLTDSVLSGFYPVGSRMPAERDLALQMGVSRPVIREALLALEVMGVVEVRVGSGAWVLRRPDATPVENEREVTPIELAQARLILEGEAAAIAAININAEEIAALDAAMAEMRREEATFEEWQDALTAFHMTMARATRNCAVERQVRDLWDMRSRSSECRRMLEQARDRNYRYSLGQHQRILDALKAHDPLEARAAVRMYLEQSIEHVLKALEERAVADARERVAAMRSRYFAGYR